MGIPASVNKVRRIIEREGLGYAIHNYLSADDIADAKLRNMWNKAIKLLDQIEEYVFAEEE